MYLCEEDALTLLRANLVRALAAIAGLWRVVDNERLIVRYRRLDPDRRGWCVAMRSITSATDTRTSLATIVPDYRQQYEVYVEVRATLFAAARTLGPVCRGLGKFPISDGAPLITFGEPDMIDALRLITDKERLDTIPVAVPPQ